MKDVLEILIAERDRINRAIEVLQGSAVPAEPATGKRPVGRPKGSGKKAAKKRGRRNFSEEARKAQSEKMKAYWAARRKEKTSKGKG
ncbi:MAG: hypothetical protein H6509_09960 [Bryobacterales bacterium]|nr:hypothetical protein [Acidobacteriota bacterium]MCB9384931.1 hypothetical protein [Bryobacterales bacterium]